MQKNDAQISGFTFMKKALEVLEKNFFGKKRLLVQVRPSKWSAEFFKNKLISRYFNLW